jgi:hypothetical protein
LVGLAALIAMAVAFFPCMFPIVANAQARSCTAGQTFCSGNCVDTTTDINNCGGCRQKCQASQVCTNGTCVASAPPVNNHANGLGQTYSDAAPPGTPGNPGTYTQTMATEACTAWPKGGTCSITCGGGAMAQEITTSSIGGSSCAVWAFGGGTSAGHVRLNSVGFPLCQCPTTSDPSWN